MVTLGGLKWEVVYLSNDIDGNPVLTLWLSNSTQDAFAGRSQTEGDYYGFINGGLYSDWSANWSNSTPGTYPSSMYGTSYIRSVTLNNGGVYATSNSSLGGNVTRDSSNVFALFTMDEFGMTEYIIKPTKIPWQRDQDQREYIGMTSFTFPNEAIAPSSPNWNGEYDYSGKTNYTAWGNDNLWLPSFTETGDSDSRLGMWKVSENQRNNYTGSSSSPGKVGSTSGSAYPNSWLRSANVTNGYYVRILPSFGTSVSNATVNASYAVRPALHLNLKKIQDSFTYWLDINGMIDGGDSADLKNYGTFDLYIDGVKIVSNGTDYYNASMTCGQTYEVKNIQAGSDKIYVGVASGSLSGEMTGNIGVYLEFRTATWEDYAADSYASGSGTEVSPYIIKTPEQMGKLAKDSRSSNCIGNYYKLGANIDLSEHIWSPIGDADIIFRGNFDGDMYQIKNVTTSVDYYLPYYAGLFARADSTITNLFIKDSHFKSGDTAGAVLGYGHSTLKNIVVENTIVESPVQGTGGLVGMTWSNVDVPFVIDSCIFNSGTVSGNNAGGIVGRSVGSNNLRITNCCVLKSNISGMWSGKLICANGGTITGTFGEANVNSTAVKQMYGDSSAWDNWSYSPLLNGGYPVQKTLFAIGGITGSQNVYNYLMTKGFGDNLYNPSKVGLDSKMTLNSDNSFTFTTNPSGSGAAWCNFFYKYDGTIPPNTTVTVVYELFSAIGANDICLCSPYDMGDDPSDVSASRVVLHADTPTGNKPSVQVVKFTTNGKTNREYNFRSYIGYNQNDTINMRFRISVFIGDIDIDANNFEYGFPN